MAWICEKCKYSNSNDISSRCEICGNKRNIKALIDRASQPNINQNNLNGNNNHTATTPVTPTQTQTSSTGMNSANTTTSKSNTIIILLVVIVILFILIAGMLIVNGVSGKTDSDEPIVAEVTTTTFGNDTILNTTDNIPQDTTYGTTSSVDSASVTFNEDYTIITTTHADTVAPTITTTVNDTSVSIENIIFPTTATSTSNTSIPCSYSLSANIVNGGHGVFDGEYYYISGGPLRKVDKNGNQTILLDNTVYYLNTDGEYLFFINSENDEIYRMKNDGTNLENICTYSSYELTLYNGMLYFCANIGGTYYICRMNTDGSNLSILYGCHEWYMTIYNGKIYFTDYASGRHIKSMNIDGTDIKTLYNDSCFDLCLIGNSLYFCVDSSSRYMYKMNLNTSEVSLIRKKFTKFTNYYNDRLYFVDESGNISSCDLNGDDEQVVYSNSDISYLTILPAKMYYCDSSNGYSLVEVPF